jgi:hypothetical protein
MREITGRFEVTFAAALASRGLPLATCQSISDPRFCPRSIPFL